MEGEDEESDNERAFGNKPAWAKIMVLLAGVIMNFIIAIVTISIVLGIAGFATTYVGKFTDESPAKEAGLRENDKIIIVNEREISEWPEISEAMAVSKEETSVTVSRGGKEISFSFKPAIEEDGRTVMGIYPKAGHSVIRAVKDGFSTTIDLSKAIFISIKELFTGKAPVSDIAGPVGIISVVNDTKQYGPLYFGFLVAFMSLNLGFLNLLPIPALDGGRILFVLIRAVTGKAITDEMEGKIHLIGMLLLFGILIFATWNDIVRLFS